MGCGSGGWGVGLGRWDGVSEGWGGGNGAVEGANGVVVGAEGGEVGGNRVGVQSEGGVVGLGQEESVKYFNSSLPARCMKIILITQNTLQNITILFD